jgi:hypothetical protein
MRYNTRMTDLAPLSPPADPFAQLNAAGLNLQAVFNVRDLGADLLDGLSAQEKNHRQLLLIGHGGTLLWQQLALHGMKGEHPVDTFSREQVAAWLDQNHAHCAYRIVYPGPATLGLQRLGRLAGWHHASPFMVGINQDWGSWFAYRVVVLADTDFAPTPPLKTPSPCSQCASRVCVSQCPAQALVPEFDLQACMNYRLRPDSACRDRCLARNSCPVGDAHRYCDAQIGYHYGRSMRMIEKLAGGRRP